MIDSEHWPDPLAFPLRMEDTGNPAFTAYGLTKRELFAMAAMQGLLSSAQLTLFIPEEGQKWEDKLAARIAVAHADSLLQQLEESSRD